MNICSTCGAPYGRSGEHTAHLSPEALAIRHPGYTRPTFPTPHMDHARAYVHEVPATEFLADPGGYLSALDTLTDAEAIALTREVQLAAKIVEMLDLRDRGALKRSGDDFISGLLHAYGIITGDQDGALERAKEQGR